MPLYRALNHLGRASWRAWKMCKVVPARGVAVAHQSRVEFPGEEHYLLKGMEILTASPRVEDPRLIENALTD